MKTQPRIAGLDLMRMSAIVLVLFAHSASLLRFNFPEFWIYWSGFIGVEIFFVLSGFLIGGIIIKTISKKDFNFSELIRFWKLRWYRTIPIYFFALLLFSIVLFLLRNYYFVFYNPKWYLYFIFLQNCWSSEPELFGVAWSLSVEEWFYILTPLTFYFAGKKVRLSSSVQLKLIITLIIIFFIVRFLYLYFGDPLSFDLDVRKRMPLRLDSLIFGVLMAYLFINFKEKLIKLKFFFCLLGVSLIALVSNIIFDNFVPTLNNLNVLERNIVFPILSIGIAFLIPFIYDLKINSYIYPSVLFISLISYSLYLFHIPIFLFVRTYFKPGVIPFFVFWTGSLIFSWITYSFIEKPILNYRDKKFKK